MDAITFADIYSSLILEKNLDGNGELFDAINTKNWSTAIKFVQTHQTKIVGICLFFHALFSGHFGTEFDVDNICRQKLFLMKTAIT